MADNDMFIIKKLNCRHCSEYEHCNEFTDCKDYEKSKSLYSLNKIIFDSIQKQISIMGSERFLTQAVCDELSEKSARAVVDRLFGEGE